MMIAVLLAIEHIELPCFICIIISTISFLIIYKLAPVEDKNKSLDQIEQKVYKKRTLVITVIEELLLLINLMLGFIQISYCIAYALMIMSMILMLGIYKNRIKNKSGVHF